MKKWILFFPLLVLSQFSCDNSTPQSYKNFFVSGGGGNKVALIIANNYYEHSSNLKAPIPTAKKLERILKNQDIAVLAGHDLNRDDFVDIIVDFSKKLEDYQTGLIFYMGHGFQIDGENYLIPSDANPREKEDVEMQAINVDYILKKINDPNKPKIIVLDACRNNPFVTNWISDSKGAA